MFCEFGLFVSIIMEIRLTTENLFTENHGGSFLKDSSAALLTLRLSVGQNQIKKGLFQDLFLLLRRGGSNSRPPRADMSPFEIFQ